MYRTNLAGKVKQLTDEVCDFSLVELMPDGKSLVVKRQSMSRADEVFVLNVAGRKPELTQLTTENDAFISSWRGDRYRNVG